MAYVDINETSKYYHFEDTEWFLIDPFPGKNLTIYSSGSTPVYLAIMSTNEEPLTDEKAQNESISLTIVGGLNYEVSNPEGTFVFGKSTQGDGILMIREFGTVNIFEDIDNLATAVSNLSVQVTDHVGDLENPHEVTKEQLGLAEISGTISSDPETNDPTILATTELTNILKTNHDNHIADLENPHSVTQEQVGLGNVPNYIAVPDDGTVIDTNINDQFITPKSAARMIVNITQPTTIAKTQCVITAPFVDRPTGWYLYEVDKPVQILRKESNYRVSIQPGLSVSFADNNKSIISEVTTEVFELDIPVSISTLMYYVYCDITKDGIISGFGMTEHKPTEGYYREFITGDFFNIATGNMLNGFDENIRRVYVGKINVEGGVIVEVTSAPIGSEVIVPVMNPVSLGSRTIEPNPFIQDCHVELEVYYNNMWGKTYWNDQMGMTANINSENTHQTIIQCGLMGFIAAGSYSGAPFGASYNPVTEAPKARLIYTKKY